MQRVLGQPVDAVAQVVGDRPGQHHRGLRDEPHAPAQHAGVERADVLPVELDRPRLDLDKPHARAQQRALARSRRAEQAGDVAGLHPQVDTLDDDPPAERHDHGARVEAGGRRQPHVRFGTSWRMRHTATAASSTASPLIAASGSTTSPTPAPSRMTSR